MGYRYKSAAKVRSSYILMPPVERLLGGNTRILEVGCGNGSNAAHLTDLGHEVIGVDPSEEGVRIAKEAYPNLSIELGSGYEDLVSKYGRFPFVLSLEVIEHVYDPRLLAKRCFEALEPGGKLIMSTPYHGYIKNLALAITGNMDKHFTALWDHGHIKFWSIKTLGELLREAGFADVRFERVGRIPALAKSMIAVAAKP